MQAAEKLYAEILRIDPQRSDVWHYLGVLASQQGEHSRAANHLQRAVQLSPNVGAYHTNLGVTFEKLGNQEQAIECYRRALELEPSSAGSHYYLGNALKAHGALRESVECYRAALRLNAGFAEAHNNLGSTFAALDRHDEAISCYRRAIECRPDYAEAHNNLGMALQRAGMPDQAADHFRRALAIQPNLADACCSLGTLLVSQDDIDQASQCFRKALSIDPDSLAAHVGLASVCRKQRRLEEAEILYRKALRLAPRSVNLWNDLGVTLQRMGKWESAMACYQEVLKREPSSARAHVNMGAVLQRMRRLAAAEEHFRKALNAKSDLTEAHLNLGNVLHEQNKYDGAAASYENAVNSDPDSVSALSQWVHERKHLCLWDELSRYTGRIVRGVEKGEAGVQPFQFINLPTNLEQQLRCARLHAEPIAARAEQLRTRLGFSYGQPSSRIRLGYVSGDFREHAISWLVAELFEQHDRERFEIFGYSFGPDDGSATRRRIEGAVDRFVDVGDLPPEQAAHRIHADGIDIAVDLSGYLPRARESILALRPAPIQVSYLGLTATMGCDWIDYLIADDFVIPPDAEKFFSESIVRLPDCYLVVDTKREIADESSMRKAHGLPETGLVFCSFNQTHKITPEVFDAWMALLDSIEGSVLWLWESNRFAPVNIRREAIARGIDPQRVVFAPSLPQAEHLARYRHADLALDTFPYNGHTTTADALWLGCPVLTCCGETFASRVAGSALRAAGLSELVTASLTEYSKVAVELASDTVRLRNYRKRLERLRETLPIFDCQRFARNIEQVFFRIREAHKPQP